MIIRIVSLIIGYFIGSLSLSFFLGLMINKDLRKYGSGNLGSTNAIRVLGYKKGLLVFAFDITKAIASCLIALSIFDVQLAPLYAGFGAVIGHCFPFYLKFTGGKGVATYLGILIFLNWKIALIVFAIFTVVFFIKRYVSLGSIISAFFCVVFWFVFYLCGYYSIDKNYFIESLLIIIFTSGLVIIKHRSNINRLLNGTENKFGKTEAIK